VVASSDDDFKLLNAKRFIIGFETGVIVIKHWKLHNYIQKDRYKPTLYQEEKSLLVDKDNKVYSLETECIHDEYSLETQVRLGKDRLELGKDRKDITPSQKSKATPTRHKYGEYQNVLLNEEDMQKLQTEFPSDWEQRIERLSAYMASTGKVYKNYLATIRNWAKRDNGKTYSQAKPKSEPLPDWVDKPVKETEMEADAQKYFQQRIEKLKESR